MQQQEERVLLENKKKRESLADKDQRRIEIEMKQK